MKYLYYKKNGTMLFIKNNNDNTNYNYIEINKEQEQEVFSWLSDNKTNLVKVLNGSLCFLINELSKRSDIVRERDNLIIQTDAYMFEDVRTEKNLTAENIEDLLEYRLRLRNMPNHYDSSTDKQTWSYVFVEVYTSGKNTNSYQLFKPEFIK